MIQPHSQTDVVWSIVFQRFELEHQLWVSLKEWLPWPNNKKGKDKNSYSLTNSEFY